KNTSLASFCTGDNLHLSKSLTNFSKNAIITRFKKIATFHPSFLKDTLTLHIPWGWGYHMIIL
ncbi:hypothetical protein, partial [Salmonella sp. s54395]|uniref:hypothetical protein n=1 Tax=Salmonella sp. s54395 TaxID=3159664 RepID=UPI00397EFF5D